jgi:hypothetical protein
MPAFLRAFLVFDRANTHSRYPRGWSERASPSEAPDIEIRLRRYWGLRSLSPQSILLAALTIVPNVEDHSTTTRPG